MNTFKRGDLVRVLHSDYPEDIPVGSVHTVPVDSDPGMGVSFGGLYFSEWELDVIESPSEAEPTQDKFATGVKYDNGKPKMSLGPACAVLGMLEAFGYGAEKYAAHNYRKGYEWTRALDAAIRHILAELEGEERDEES